MKRGRIIRLGLGTALLLGALITLAVELYGWWRDDVWEIIYVGAVWASVHANSLVGFGAFVEKSVSPWLWTNVLVPFLTLPLWLATGLPGLVLLALGQRKRRRTYFYRR